MPKMNDFRLALLEACNEWEEAEGEGKVTFTCNGKKVIAQEDGFYEAENGLPAAFHVEAQEAGWRRVG